MVALARTLILRTSRAEIRRHLCRNDAGGLHADRTALEKRVIATPEWLGGFESAALQAPRRGGLPDLLENFDCDAGPRAEIGLVRQVDPSVAAVEELRDGVGARGFRHNGRPLGRR